MLARLTDAFYSTACFWCNYEVGENVTWRKSAVKIKGQFLTDDST